MARVTIEDALKIIPNQFDLINVAIKRVKQLENNQPPLIAKKHPLETNMMIALREIEMGKVGVSLLDEDLK